MGEEFWISGGKSVQMKDLFKDLRLQSSPGIKKIDFRQ